MSILGGIITTFLTLFGLALFFGGVYAISKKWSQDKGSSKPDESKKKSGWPVWLTCVITIVVIIGISFFGYSLFSGENNVSRPVSARQPSLQYNWERLLEVEVYLPNPNEWSNWYEIGKYNHLRVAPDGCILFRTDKNLNKEEMICTEEELPGTLTRSTKFQFISRENRPVKVTISYG